MRAIDEVRAFMKTCREEGLDLVAIYVSPALMARLEADARHVCSFLCNHAGCGRLAIDDIPVEAREGMRDDEIRGDAR